MGIQTASKHWRESGEPLLEKLINLEKDVFNAPFHYYGIHDGCRDYYCSKTTEPEAREIVDMLKDESIFNEILNICQTYFGCTVPSLLLNYNNNAAESFNNLIAKYTGKIIVISVYPYTHCPCVILLNRRKTNQLLFGQIISIASCQSSGSI